MELSVIICTHNPRTDYLSRALDALQKQTLAKEQWELLLIDNASREPLAAKWDLSWHPHGKILGELRQGLSWARKCGLAHCRGKLAVFVDDDNVLDADYLSEAVRFFQEQEFAGAAGGAVLGEFEMLPPEWLMPRLGCLAVGKENVPTGKLPSGEFVWGAGLVLRTAVWKTLTDSGFEFVCSGRTGKLLLGGEDVELCKALQHLGWEIWHLDGLKITHLMPKRRCEWTYIRNLFRANGASTIFFDPYNETQPQNLAGVRYRWWWRALSVCQQILKRPGDILAFAGFAKEGSERVLRLESRIGRLLMLINSRMTYRSMLERVRDWKARVSRTGKPAAGPTPVSSPEGRGLTTKIVAG